MACLAAIPDKAARAMIHVGALSPSVDALLIVSKKAIALWPPSSPLFDASTSSGANHRRSGSSPHSHSPGSPCTTPAPDSASGASVPPIPVQPRHLAPLVVTAARATPAASPSSATTASGQTLSTSSQSDAGTSDSYAVVYSFALSLLTTDGEGTANPAHDVGTCCTMSNPTGSSSDGARRGSSDARRKLRYTSGSSEEEKSFTDISLVLAEGADTLHLGWNV
jgi:hypothetical protein